MDEIHVQLPLYITVTLGKWPGDRYIKGDRYIQVSTGRNGITSLCGNNHIKYIDNNNYSNAIKKAPKMSVV